MPPGLLGLRGCARVHTWEFAPGGCSPDGDATPVFVELFVLSTGYSADNGEAVCFPLLENSI